MSLKEWLINYIKSRQSMDGHIEKLEEDKTSITVHRESGIHKYYFFDELTIPDLKEDRTTIATLNTKANIKALVKVWKQVKTHPKLNILFINPKTNMKWSVFPHTHDRITEAAVLESGLLSLAQESGII